MSFSFAVVSTLPLHIFYFHFCIFVVSVGAVVVWNVKQVYDECTPKSLISVAIY